MVRGWGRVSARPINGDRINGGAGSVMTIEEELRICAGLIGRFEAAIQSPRESPLPTGFQPLWNELRSSLDGTGDVDRAIDLLLKLPKNACDPGSATYLGYVPNTAFPVARTVDGYLSAVNAVAAGRIDGESFVEAEYAIADKIGELAGFPEDTRGGTFVQGGTLANFCAMAVARDRWRRRSRSRGSSVIIGSSLTHSSIKVAARLLDMRFIPIDYTAAGSISVDALKDAITRYGARIAAVIGNAGTTTAGSIDPLGSVGELAHECGAWFHVDGAYGGAVIMSARHRHLLSGLADADSFVVDPHKWLFCPYDSSLLLYRDAGEVHKELKVFSQTYKTGAEYLDFGFRHTAPCVLPSQLPLEVGDLALQLSRRPRGVVLWALVAMLGVDGLGRHIDAAIDAIDYLHSYARERGVGVPVAPMLSVLLLSQEKWKYARDWDDYWVAPSFEKGYFVSTDSWNNRPVGRLCLINPAVTGQELEPLVDIIADWRGRQGAES
jgi:L-2,4-diaminobutyrate decarboxylase